MMVMRLAIVLVSLALWSFASTVHSVKLYKWVDQAGNVTYQDHLPPTGSGAVEEKNIDPNQNALKFVIPTVPENTTPANPGATRGHSAQRGGDDNDERGGVRTIPASDGMSASGGMSPILGGGATSAGAIGGAVAPPPPPPSVPAGTGAVAPPPPPPSVPAGSGPGF
ncbi:MAG: DUF4124 domain-containing protein [Acidiferrobacterales bacterium]